MQMVWFTGKRSKGQKLLWGIGLCEGVTWALLGLCGGVTWALLGLFRGFSDEKHVRIGFLIFDMFKNAKKAC